MLTTRWNFKLRKKGEVEWASPQTLMIVILVVLAGLAFIFFALKLKGRFP